MKCSANTSQAKLIFLDKKVLHKVKSFGNSKFITISPVNPKVQSIPNQTNKNSLQNNMLQNSIF